MFKSPEKINPQQEGENKNEKELETKKEFQQNMVNLEELNAKMENEELSPEEIEDLFKQMADVEGKLDMLEKDLGLSSEEAIEVMTMIQKGEVDFEKEMEDLEKAMQAEDVLEADKESFLRKLVGRAEGPRKLMKAAALVLLMTLGTASLAQAAEGHSAKVENLKTTHSIELQQNAGIFGMQLNSRGDSEAKDTWLSLNVMAGLPKPGEKLEAYLERALEKSNIKFTQQSIDNLISQF